MTLKWSEFLKAALEPVCWTDQSLSDILELISKWGDLMGKISLQAIRSVVTEENGTTQVDIKHFVKIEKVCNFRLFFYRADILDSRRRRYRELRARWVYV